MDGARKCVMRITSDHKGIFASSVEFLYGRVSPNLLPLFCGFRVFSIEIKGVRRLSATNYIKLIALIVGVAAVNIVVLSPGFIGIAIGASAFDTAVGITLLLASALALIYGIYSLLQTKPPAAVPIREIRTQAEYAEALSRYRRVKALEGDIRIALEQLERMDKRKDALLEVLRQRFDPGELSYRKFASAVEEVEKLFYLNLRSLLNRLNLFDEADFERVMRRKQAMFKQELLQEKVRMYQEFLTFVHDSLGTSEEMLLKLDKLLIEISRLDSLDPADIEHMPCMQEIDSLIRQTKYYKQ